MQQVSNKKEEAVDKINKFNNLFTTLSVAVFLIGFYLAGSLIFAGSAWYIRLFVVVVSLVISAGFLYKTLHWERIIFLFKGARIELKKVFWPSKNELTRTTLMVLVMVAVFAIFFSIIDGILTLLIRGIL